MDDPFAFWYGLINYEQRTPTAGDLKLSRMRALLARLGSPQERLPIVHVAGSKGKGSTSAMLAAVLRQAGYRTGLFTSPHLCRVEERFQIDGVPISTDELGALLIDVREAVERGRAGRPALEPTFFEVGTAVGFLHFVRRRVDVAVVEVGLGGRLDSTNVCRPLVALITSISYDHTRLLGDRLASIAREKAGILKRDRPAISGATGEEPRTAIEEVARTRRVPLRQLGIDFRYRHEPGHVDAAGNVQPTRVEVTTWRQRWPWMQVNLLGEHQAANAAVVVACIEELRAQGWHLPDAAVAAGLAGVVWPARLEIAGHAPLIVLDCAHNVASAEALRQTLETSFPPCRRLLIFAGSSDKDVAGMFRVLAPAFAHIFLTRFTNNLRAVSPEHLGELLRGESDTPFTLCATPAEALHAARAMAGAGHLIGVAGSVFLAGEMRTLLNVPTSDKENV
jgi:dihydrofolate synthase/folylpolyglutamate synthase